MYQAKIDVGCNSRTVFAGEEVIPDSVPVLGDDVHPRFPRSAIESCLRDGSIEEVKELKPVEGGGRRYPQPAADRSPRGMAPSFAFLLVDPPLPDFVIDAEAPKETGAEYERIKAAIGTIDSDRENAKRSAKSLIEALIRQFQVESLVKLNAMRVDILHCYQKELDAYDNLHKWMRSYVSVLGKIMEKAVETRSTHAAGVQSKMIDGAEFDDKLKEGASHIEGVISLHPKMRKASARIKQIADHRADVSDILNAKLPEDSMQWGSRLYRIQLRRKNAETALREGLREMFRAQGLESTVKSAYMCGCDCGSLLLPVDL